MPTPTDGPRILVAGATGMTGRGLVTELLARFPKAVLRGTWHTLPPDVVDPRVEWLQADLTCPEQCRRAAQDCQLAVLAAARTGGAQAAVSRPHLQVTDNLVMDAYLLEACALQGVSRVVYISSATVYPDQSRPLAEADLDWNQDPPPAYLGVGWAKRAAEKLCWFWHQRHGLEVTILRAANIFGPFARFEPTTANVVPALVRKAVARCDPFDVWGSPEVTRDFVFVEDFARAVATVIAGPGGFHIYNVGSGQPTRVADIVRWVLAATGHAPARVHYSPSSPTTVQYRSLDSRRIHDELGWMPSVPIAEGIRLTAQWWSQSADTWNR